MGPQTAELRRSKTSLLYATLAGSVAFGTPPRWRYTATVTNPLSTHRPGPSGAPSVASWMVWRGLVFAIPAGFIAAWPINYWLLKRELKA